jgi:hypothetical protein
LCAVSHREELAFGVANVLPDASKNFRAILICLFSTVLAAETAIAIHIGRITARTHLHTHAAPPKNK